MYHEILFYIPGKDFLCVQSMDGTVSVFEQESFAFTRFLPGALLPGPIKYVPRLDSFITVSSSWQLECYKYVMFPVCLIYKLILTHFWLYLSGQSTYSEFMVY
jgi:hypothetical protein